MSLNLPIAIGDALAGKDDAGGFVHPANMRPESVQCQPGRLPQQSVGTLYRLALASISDFMFFLAQHQLNRRWRIWRTVHGDMTAPCQRRRYIP
jgi:hypothetical protein